MIRETFGLGSKGKDNCIHLTSEQAAMIRIGFTPEGRAYFDKLYAAMHLDLFGNCANMSKKPVTNSRLGNK